MKALFIYSLCISLNSLCRNKTQNRKLKQQSPKHTRWIYQNYKQSGENAIEALQNGNKKLVFLLYENPGND